MNFLRKTILVLALIGALSGCDQLDAMLASVTAPVEQLVPHIVSTRPHDPMAFTEGLFLDSGHLYESTGNEGAGHSSLSSMREVDPQTGAVQRIVELRAEIFGEGIARVGDRLVQLTWQNGAYITYDLTTFQPSGVFAYDDVGWGMCYDGTNLFTSNGSAQITERDPETMASTGTIDVLLQGKPIDQLNELECVGDSIYSNIWHSDNILRIDKATGRVTAVIDASGLLTADQRTKLVDSESVLNGIAYDPATGNFLLTGKLWPWLFEVQFAAP